VMVNGSSVPVDGLMMMDDWIEIEYMYEYIFF